MISFINKKEKGVSLIITFFIMLIVLVIVLAISTLLYSQIKVIRNIGNSVIAFYAADSGIEKILFYDKQVIPDNATRGLCSIFNQVDNDNPCITDPNQNDVNSDHSIYCNEIPGGPNPPSLITLDPTNHPDGCDPEKCNSCEIDFSTKIKSDKGYILKAKISPSTEGTTNDLSIDSAGYYKDVNRSVNVLISKATPQQVITVVSASAVPRSVGNGIAVDIDAEIKSPNGVSRVFAIIKDSPATDGSHIIDTITLGCSDTDLKDRTCCARNDPGSTYCAQSEVLPQGAYYVDLDIFDMHEIELKYPNIWPVGS